MAISQNGWVKNLPLLNPRSSSRAPEARGDPAKKYFLDGHSAPRLAICRSFLLKVSRAAKYCLKGVYVPPTRFGKEPKNVQCPKKALGYKKVLALSQNGWVSVATPSPAKANALATSPGGRGVSFSIPMHVYIFKNKKEITSPPGRGRRQRRRVRAFQNRTFSNDATLCIFLMTTPLWHWQ